MKIESLDIDSDDASELIENCKLIIVNYQVMPSERRLEKINELIHRFISDLLRREYDFDSLVTVTSVSTSGNGQECSISVTVFPFEKSKLVLKEIQKNIYQIQQSLNRGLRIRPVPKVRFKIDESEEKGSVVLKKISEVEKNGL